MDIKIIVATHKEFWMPQDGIYLPIQVGAAREGHARLPYWHDDEGDNISAKNANYCELTGLYWAWKNLSAEYIGLVHYRRHFVKDGTFGKKKSNIVDGEYLEKAFESYDVILPKKRNYFIESNYTQYVHAHHEQDLTLTRQIIGNKYPDYLKFYDEVMKSTSGHRFNMFVMKKQYFDDYCSWLFDILFELEKVLDISSYSEYDARVFGFVSERLLDVWIRRNAVKYKELKVVFLEKENWVAKIFNFIVRKFKGKN